MNLMISNIYHWNFICLWTKYLHALLHCTSFHAATTNVKKSKCKVATSPTLNFILPFRFRKSAVAQALPDLLDINPNLEKVEKYLSWILKKNFLKHISIHFLSPNFLSTIHRDSLCNRGTQETNMIMRTCLK